MSVPFALTALRSGSYTYHQASVVHQGVEVQVQSLVVSSGSSAFYGSAGGASMEILFSGLPADMELLSFLRLEASESFTGATQGDTGPGRIDLEIPGMTVDTPAFTLLQGPAWPSDPSVRSVAPTVGPSGTVRLVVSYLGSGTPTGQPATLSISQIQLLSGGIDGNTGSPPVLPAFSHHPADAMTAEKGKH